MHSHIEGHPGLLTAVQEIERRKPDQFEIYFEKKRSLKIDAKDQKVESVTHTEDAGLSIRVLCNQQPGFSFTTSMDSDAISQTIASAFEVAEVMPADPAHRLYSFGESVYPTLDRFDPDGLAISTEEKTEIALQLERRCLEYDPRIKGVRTSSFRETEYEVQMIDSSGNQIQDRGTIFSANVMCKAQEGDDAQVGAEYDFAKSYAQLDVSEISQKAAIQATELLGATSAPTMRCPAVFRNSVVSQMLSFLSSSFSAEQIDKGRSMLAGKQGQRVFGDRVDIYDDGLHPEGLGSSPFDAEGVPAQKTTLIENGVFTQTLYDLYYANKLGAKPTGSAVRSIQSPPSIGFSNLYMKPGTESVDHLYKMADKGILITDLMGVHTANPITGDFSLGASGILIEKGILTRPVKGFAVAGNILEVFRRVSELGSDLRFFGNVGTPSLLVDEVSVGGE